MREERELATDLGAAVSWREEANWGWGAASVTLSLSVSLWFCFLSLFYGKK